MKRYKHMILFLIIVSFSACSHSNKDQNEHGAMSSNESFNKFFEEPSEVDTNKDGKIDQWNIYSEDHNIIEKRFDTNFDGNADVYEFFGKEKTIERKLSDRNFDNKIDQWEIFKQKYPVLAVVKMDNNFDGKVDRIVETIMESEKFYYFIREDANFDGVFEIEKKQETLDK